MRGRQMGSPFDPNQEMRKFIGHTLIEEHLIAWLTDMR